jgi:CheY-like chemotaxis protein
MSRVVFVLLVCINTIQAIDVMEYIGEDKNQLAVYAMALVALLILFVFSKQVRNIKRMYQNMFRKQQIIEEKQAEVLAQMSEQIQSITKDVISNCPMDDESYIPNKAGNKSELLDITNDLIDFLRLKSKRVEITHDKFNINNVLNEVSGRLGYQHLGSKIEVVFDIDNDIPRYLIGDSLHFGEILYNLLEFSVESLTESELILYIQKRDKNSTNVVLKFQIVTQGKVLSNDEIDSLFIPYFDEEKKEYQRLGLFVAYELTKLMNGKVDVHSKKNQGTVFELELPFEIHNPDDFRKYRLPDKVMIQKRILIVDKNEHSVKALQKMFGYFRNNVDIISSDKFAKKKPDFSRYDIVVFDEDQFTYRVTSYLKTLKLQEPIKVVSLNSLLNIDKVNYNDPVIDEVLLKPVNQERIFELIISLYDLEDSEYNTTHSKIETYREDISELPNITQESFRDFRGYRILIVEDNIVNQRVLVSLLKPAGIVTVVASNGKEAVDLLQKNSEEKFDLIVMDINMPVMDGFVATRAIRYDPKFDNIPIIALTALVLESEQRKMFDSGMNAYLSKPLNISKLYSALRLFLKPKEDDGSFEEKKVVEGDSNILNVKRGIVNTNNNQLLYGELLNQFVESYGKSDTTFEKLVMEHRYEQLRMMSVDVRGISATIGAYSMNRKVEEISKHIVFKRYDELGNAIIEYREELQALLQNIRIYLDQ